MDSGKISIVLLLCTLMLFSKIQVIGQTNPQMDSLIQILENSNPDTNKVRLYFQLYSYTAFNNPDLAKNYILEALSLAQNLHDRKGIILCYDKLGGIEMNLANFRKAQYYYRKADSMLVDMNWPREQAIIYGNYAALYKDIGLYDSAIYWNDKFIHIAESLNNDLFKAFGLGITGDIYQTKGQYNLAARNHLLSLRIYESIGAESRTADALLKLGQAQMAGEHFADAEKNIKKAISIYEKINDQYYLRESYDNLGYLFLQLDNFEESEKWYQKANEIALSLGDAYGIAQSLEGFEQIAYEKRQYELALSHNLQSLELYQQIEDRYNLAWRYAHLVNIYLKLGQSDKAFAYNQLAEGMFRELNLPSGLRKTYQNYYLLYQLSGSTAEALEAFEHYHIIKDSLVNSETATQIEELQLIYDVEKKDQEIQLLSKDAELNLLKRQRLRWGLLFTGLLGGLVIYIQFMRRKRDQRIQKERHKLQALELEKNKLEKEQLERELTAQILQICRKNELLTSLQHEVSAISNQTSSEHNSKLRKLERTIVNDIQSDEDWTQFLLTFEKVHPSFLKRLRTKVNSLSSSEQRLACLFRMNLSSKEIATMLNISDDGVKKARYRLRKKLGLASQINLQNYIINFSPEDN